MFVGIDISKEKLNLCFRTASRIVCEEEIENTSAVIKRQLKKSLRDLETTLEEREFDISTSLLNMSMSQPEHVLQHKEARKYR